MYEYVDNPLQELPLDMRCISKKPITAHFLYTHKGRENKQRQATIVLIAGSQAIVPKQRT